MGNEDSIQRQLCRQGVTNASRHWVHGERPEADWLKSCRWSGHKCLSALGSWGTHGLAQHLEVIGESQMPLGIGFMGNQAVVKQGDHLKGSQMPLGIGFMGNPITEDGHFLAFKKSQMPLGIGFMGNAFYVTDTEARKIGSQMPLGIGFMGNATLNSLIHAAMSPVTNASRHWVHGERNI